MILREIVKKIRQIELRTNRLVTESVACGCTRTASETVIQKIFDDLPVL